ncbi:MAG: YggS family pyridoxal phosphate-dependent enzyme [Spirochaetes bacterium]|nr:YggS family pyridoxal phosphate-dependent enzyme [Spirochaetota bacterium]
MNPEDALRLRERISGILARLPVGVSLCAVVKSRTPGEIAVAIESGIGLLGSNYVQETLDLQGRLEREYGAGRDRARWRFIGHLQSNKIRALAPRVDSVDTLDRPKIASILDACAAERGSAYPVLVEVNSGREPQKAGVFPEAIPEFIASLAPFAHLRIEGLMTMGPAGLGGDGLRPYFAQTRACFEALQSVRQPNLFPTTLSMGMSDSWEAAIAEGANLVRIGTALFGPRPAA